MSNKNLRGQTKIIEKNPTIDMSTHSNGRIDLIYQLSQFYSLP